VSGSGRLMVIPPAQNDTQVATRGEAYEPLTGRWSRQVAPVFLSWLDVGPNGRWLDVGCGTGALIQAILKSERPDEVVGIDPSSAFIAYARREIGDPRVRLEVGDARSLPVTSKQYEGVVSGLVLNVLPVAGQLTAVREMARAARRGGVVGAYVWDYASGMEPRTYFWNVATELDPAAAELDERTRYPICQPGALVSLFRNAGLNAVESGSVTIETRFVDFDDYWTPFLAGYGIASTYVVGLPEERRERLRRALQQSLPSAHGGSIVLHARAWTVRGVS
jgi:SAM-dependent methyltransferase